MQSNQKLLGARNVVLWGTILFTAACGGSADTTVPWEEETVTVYSQDGVATTASIGEGCGDVGDAACDAIIEECGDRGAADVFLDDRGEVIEVICFPAAGDTNEVISVSSESAPPVVDNNDVVVLEGDADTPAIVGDVTLDSNNVVLYGDDPATSVLDGNLDITKNNALITGITITGDVHITFNNATLSNCVIEGNLRLEGNNARIAGCTVLGDVTVIGNNNVLSSTIIEGQYTDEGENTCLESEAAGEDLQCALDPEPTP